MEKLRNNVAYLRRGTASFPMHVAMESKLSSRQKRDAASILKKGLSLSRLEKLGIGFDPSRHSKLVIGNMGSFNCDGELLFIDRRDLKKIGRMANDNDMTATMPLHLRIENALKKIGEIEGLAENIKSNPDILSYLALSLKRDMGATLPITRDNLAVIYTPTVAEPCVRAKELLDATKEVEAFYLMNRGNKTIRRLIENRIFSIKRFIQVLEGRYNSAAVATNATAILGKGDLGEAGMAVMHGKATLLALAGIIARGFFIHSRAMAGFLDVIRSLGRSVSVLMMEDFKAQECFKEEPAAQRAVDIPVFHDDQHATSTVILAAMINAIKLRGKDKETARIVILGAGASGGPTAFLLAAYGFKNIIVCDSEGAINKKRKGLDGIKPLIAKFTNKNGFSGSKEDAVAGADILIELARERIITKDMVRSMNEKPVIFTLSNPTPGIRPEEALEAGAYIVATGSSRFPNQINNSLCFPGFTRAFADYWIKRPTTEIKIAAAEAIARNLREDELSPDRIIPSMFNRDGNPNFGLIASVAEAVAKKAIETGQAMLKSDEIGFQKISIEDGKYTEKRIPYSRFFLELAVKNLFEKARFDMPAPEELEDALMEITDAARSAQAKIVIKPFKCAFQGRSGLLIAGPKMPPGFMAKLTKVFGGMEISIIDIEHVSLENLGIRIFHLSKNEKEITDPKTWEGIRKEVEALFGHL